MNPVGWGIASAGALGCADFVARFSSKAIGHGSALFGMLLISTVTLTVYILVVQADAPLPSVIPWAIIVHGIAFAATMLLLYAALAIGPIRIVIPIIATHPAIVVLWTWLRGTDMTGPKMAGLAMVLIGCATISMSPSGIAAAHGQTDRHETRNRAVAIAMITSVVYALALITGQEAARAYNAVSTLWLGRITALLTLAPYFLFMRERPHLPLRWWPALSAQGLLDACGMMFLLLGSLGAHRDVTAVMSSGFGAVTILLAWVFLKERLTIAQFAATMLIFVGAGALSSAIA